MLNAYKLKVMFWFLDDDGVTHWMPFNHIDQKIQTGWVSGSSISRSIRFGGVIPKSKFDENENFKTAKLQGILYLSDEDDNYSYYAETTLKDVKIYKYSGPIIHQESIEFDCAAGNTGDPSYISYNIVDNYNSNIKDALESAFTTASIEFNNIFENETSIAEPDIEYNNYILTAELNDIDYGTGSDDNKHLLSFRFYLDSNGDPLNDVFGIHVPIDEDYQGVYTFIGAIVDEYNEENWTFDLTNLIVMTIVHEMGHSYGLNHSSGGGAVKEEHNSPFCIMNSWYYYEGDNDDDPNPSQDPTGYMRWFMQNPHFCDKCITKITEYYSN